MVQEFRFGGQKTHAKTTRVMEAQFELRSEVENKMIVRRIVVDRWPDPQAPGHAQMQHQHAIWLQVHQQVFGPSVYACNGAPYGHLMQGSHVDQVAQLSLPHPYASDGLAGQAGRQATADGFDFW